ncbi:MAG: protein phosphatase 2C domain-containing protein [Planctomycetota bacterium]
MREAKNTQRALVKIGFDGRVHKYFRGPQAEERFANEVEVLKYLESRQCPFVPRLLESDSQELKIVTSNVGSIVEHISDDKAAAVFKELLDYGVRHDDPFPRNITYRASDGRFCAIDFEFATIVDPEWNVSQGSAQGAAALPVQVSEELRLEWSGCTDRGRFRPNNEDAFLLLKLSNTGVQYLGKEGQARFGDGEYVFAVSDGMGGENSGEFASRIALEKITLRLPNESFSDSPAQDSLSKHTEEVLLELFRSIHEAMLRLGRSDPNCRDMGATLTLVWLRRNSVYFAHIGDSRLYRMQNEALEQISEDHSHIGWLRRAGQIGEREARAHPRRNVLDQALGADHKFLNPHIGSVDLQPGDKLLICSDGVTEALWDSRIESLMSQEGASGRAKLIVDCAVVESGRDNTTAVVIGTDSP